MPRFQLTPEDITRARQIACGMTCPDTQALCWEWCEAAGVDMDDIRSPSKVWRLVEARQGLAWVLRHNARLSLPAIARIINRDHTSVLNLLRREHKRREASRPEPD